MGQHRLSSLWKRLGLMLALLVPADRAWCGPQIRNPQSEIRNWEPLGLSGGGGMFAPRSRPPIPTWSCSTAI